MAGGGDGSGPGVPDQLSQVRSYRELSFWLDTCGDDLGPRPPLAGSTDVDVAIVGAGYTGLWTAHYLRRADPGLRIAILEKEIAGFGASGRNGGWCSALFAASKDKIARSSSRDAAVAMQRAMFETVDEVGRAAAELGIDCDYVKSGTIDLATAPSQVARIREAIEHEWSWGFGSDDFSWLEGAEARRLVAASRVLGAGFTPHCATIHPAKLARGLARAVVDQGIELYEKTPVTEILDRSVVTPAGTVRAEVVVRATEGYTPRLPGFRRALVPLYSLMICTEPLPSDFWDEVGWRNRETLHDGRHLIIYAQRTADDRIAIGGRGAPYHYASRIRDSYDLAPAVFAELQRVLVHLFPGARDAAITHRWGGCLGVPRDWYSSVGFDRSTGFAWAGGYVGDGVSTTNLAGRTLADLITGKETDITRLPWVDRRSRRWEPEPLRWLGINGALKLMASADKVEARTGRPARRAKLLSRLTGD